MSTNYHTPLAVDGTSADAADINTPLGELDAELTLVAATISAYFGTGDEVLAGWVSAPSLEMLTITYDADGLISSATVKWPDGSAGVYTTTVANATFLEVDAFTVTHTDSGRTVTQPTVTRDANGKTTVKPAMVVT